MDAGSRGGSTLVLGGKLPIVLCSGCPSYVPTARARGLLFLHIRSSRRLLFVLTGVRGHLAGLAGTCDDWRCRASLMCLRVILEKRLFMFVAYFLTELFASCCGAVGAP